MPDAENQDCYVCYGACTHEFALPVWEGDLLPSWMDAEEAANQVVCRTCYFLFKDIAEPVPAFQARELRAGAHRPALDQIRDDEILSDVAALEDTKDQWLATIAVQHSVREQQVKRPHFNREIALQHLAKAAVLLRELNMMEKGVAR